MGQHTCNTLAKHSHLQTCIKYDLNRDYVLQEDKTLTELIKLLKIKNGINCCIHLNVILQEHLSLSFTGSYDLIPWCGLILLSLMNCTHLQRAIVCTAWYQVPQLKSYRWSHEWMCPSFMWRTKQLNASVLSDEKMQMCNMSVLNQNKDNINSNISGELSPTTGEYTTNITTGNLKAL